MVTVDIAILIDVNRIKCLDLFGHGLTLEAVSYFVIVMFDCHNLPGKAVNYFIVVMFLWSQLTSQLY